MKPGTRRLPVAGPPNSGGARADRRGDPLGDPFELRAQAVGEAGDRVEAERLARACDVGSRVQHVARLAGGAADVERPSCDLRQQVQRLIDGGVMQVVAVTDPLELGFARQAMVGVRVQGPLEPVADALTALDEVDYVVITAGSFDLLVEVVCESDDHLLDLISRSIRTVEGVVATETFMYLSLRKQTYSWGVR